MQDADEDRDEDRDGPVETVLEDARWEAFGAGPKARRAAEAALRHRGLDPAQVEVSLLLTDDARIAGLNGTYRGKPAPTNVLSWPSEDLAPEAPGEEPFLPEPGPDGIYALGDMAISWDTCAREVAQGETPLDLDGHFTHLVIHSILHLLGYDHETEADAALMEGWEREILAGLGLAAPER